MVDIWPNPRVFQIRVHARKRRRHRLLLSDDIILPARRFRHLPDSVRCLSGRPFSRSLPMRYLATLCGVLAMLPPAPAVDPTKYPSRPELPDPLVMLDGTKVTTKEEWAAKRRPELKELFQDLMYGRQPARMD